MVYPYISFSKHFVIEASASGLLNDQKETSRAYKMSQRAKALAARVDNLNSVPRIHMVEGENCFPEVVL